MINCYKKITAIKIGVWCGTLFIALLHDGIFVSFIHHTYYIERRKKHIMFI